MSKFPYHITFPKSTKTHPTKTFTKNTNSPLHKFHPHGKMNIQNNIKAVIFKLKILELFAGTRSIGKAFEEKGHQVYSVEWDHQHKNIDLYTDILTVTSEQILKDFGRPDIIWASPDCTTYSIAAISTHRHREEDGHLSPKSDKAIQSDKVNKHVLKLIKELKPKYYFIENPRGAMRKMRFMKDIPIYTVTYCQYGDTRMKPTDRKSVV